jgi:hypothetical protein
MYQQRQHPYTAAKQKTSSLDGCATVICTIVIVAIAIFKAVSGDASVSQGPASTSTTSDDIIIGPVKTVDELMQKVAEAGGIAEVIRVGPRNAGAEQRCAEAGISMRTVPTITAKKIREMGKGKRVLFHIARSNLMPAEAGDLAAAETATAPAKPEQYTFTPTPSKAAQRHKEFEEDGATVKPTGDDDWVLYNAKDHLQTCNVIFKTGVTKVVEIGKGHGMESFCAGNGIMYIKLALYKAEQNTLNQLAEGDATLFYITQ